MLSLYSALTYADGEILIHADTIASALAVSLSKHLTPG